MQTDLITLLRPVWCWSSNLSKYMEFCHESNASISETRWNRYVGHLLDLVISSIRTCNFKLFQACGPCAANVLRRACSPVSFCALHGQELLDLDLAVLDIAPLPQVRICTSPAKVHAKIRLSPVSAANRQMQSGLICRVFQRSNAVRVRLVLKLLGKGQLWLFRLSLTSLTNQKVLKVTRGRSYGR